MPGSLATRYAPSWRLIALHFGLGLCGLLAFSIALLWRAGDLSGFFFQPVLLGLVHLCVLGWLVPIAMGALHQLIPVVFEVPVRSERIAFAALAMYAVAAPVFIFEMWRLDLQQPAPLALAIAATSAASALLLYVGNLVATLRRSRQRTLTGLHVTFALGYLVLAVSLGTVLAWNLHHPFLPIVHIALLRAHAHAAGLGFFGLLIMGVAYRLLEMFLLSYGAPDRAGRIGFFAINGALAALLASFVIASRWLAPLGVFAAVVGVGAFFVQVSAIFRRRTRKKTDVAWRHTFTSLVYLGSTLAVGAALALWPLAGESWARLHLAYGLLAIPGFVGTIVVGQLYKIVPFLVWLHRFSPYVGLKKVPSASELLPERPKRIQYAAMHLGLGALLAGVLADVASLRTAGAAAFVASAVLVARNLGVIYARKP